MVELFQVLLESGLTNNADWWLHARLWRIYFLSDIRGFWCEFRAIPACTMLLFAARALMFGCWLLCLVDVLVFCSLQEE